MKKLYCDLCEEIVNEEIIVYNYGVSLCKRHTMEGK